MAEQHLTKSELAIMEVMWEQEEALTASEIIKASGDKEWKNSSIHLMVNALLEKGFLEVAGFKKTTKNYARTFKPTMTKEKYFVRKVMGNTPVAEKKKIYMQLLKEVDEIETLDTIKEMPGQIWQWKAALSEVMKQARYNAFLLKGCSEHK